MKRKIALLLTFALLVSSIFLSSSNTNAASKKPKLNIKKLNMTVGNDFRLRVYNLKKKQRVTYSSSNLSVVTVKSTAARGKRAIVKSQGIGSATITATIRKGKKINRRLKCRVKVSPTGICIKFLKRNVHMKTNSKFRTETIIKPNTSTEVPIYESDNPEVAIINSRGVITAVSPGTATITATLLSTNQKAVCKVTVSHPVSPEETTAGKYKKYKEKKTISNDFSDK